MAPYPPIERWQVTEKVCELSRNAVQPAGLVGCESGVFWLGRRAGASEITVVVHPVGDGVQETPFDWRVAPEVYAAVTAWAKPRSLTLLAVVHTHLSALPPRMSPTDRHQGLKTPDALAVIIPSAGAEPDPRRWGWFVYSGDDYRPLGTAEMKARVAIVPGAADLIVVGDEEAA
jgi:hypothetical protein